MTEGHNPLAHLVIFIVIGMTSMVSMARADGPAHVPSRASPAPPQLRLKYAAGGVVADPSLFAALDSNSDEPRESSVEYVHSPKEDTGRPAGVSKVHRARLGLALGIPFTVSGAAALAFGAKGKCYDEQDKMKATLIAGGILLSAGIALDVPSIMGLVRASKQAKDAPKTRQQRRQLIGAAIGGTLLGASVPAVLGTGEWLVCGSS